MARGFITGFILSTVRHRRALTEINWNCAGYVARVGGCNGVLRSWESICVEQIRRIDRGTGKKAGQEGTKGMHGSSTESGPILWHFREISVIIIWKILKSEFSKDHKLAFEVTKISRNYTGGHKILKNLA
jgi:hypothetical protein